MNSTPAYADSGCSASEPSWQCRLQSRLTSILHLLDATAIVLGLVTIVVVILAVNYYRRTKNKNEPT